MRSNFTVFFLMLAVGCGDDGASPSGGAGGAGAGPTAGGSPATGGSPANGGGTTQGGGVDPSGGSPSTGGSSPGCGIDQDGGVTTQPIQAAGLDRSYLRVVPTGYDPSQPIPVVFVWHGNNWSGESLREQSMTLETAFGEPAIFVYANGLEVDELPIEAAGGVDGTGWDWRPAGRDVALFDAILEDLRENFCIDSSRVFSFGRSHGGFFANALACARGDVIRRTAVVSGGFPGTVVGDACAAASMPIWIAHNAGDDSVVVSYAQQARDHWVARNGCDSTTTAVSPAPCASYDGCASAGVTYCEVNANSHEPPSFALETAAIFFAAP